VRDNATLNINVYNNNNNYNNDNVNPQTVPTVLGCESAGRLIPHTSSSPFIIISVVTVAVICNSVGGGFFDMPLGCRWHWQISVGVKARAVNRKWVDVKARSDPGCPGMR